MSCVTTADVQWAIGILVGVAGLTLAFFTYRFTRRRKLKALYEVMQKTSRYLQPEEIMRIRGNVKHGFDRYFYPRDQVAEIQKRIAKDQNVLVVGNPLAGKTRTVFEALHKIRPSCDVTVAKPPDLSSEDLRIPFRWTEWRKGILVVDDLHQFIGKPTFDRMLEMFIDKGYTIVATCRAGPELKRATAAMAHQFASLFGDPVEIGQVSADEAAVIAKDTEREPPEGFDGNIGSIFLRLETMRQHYADCGKKAQAILRSLKRLHMAGLYKEKDLFPVEWVKRVCEEQEDLTCKKYEWGDIVGKLDDDGFLRKRKDVLQAEEVYLEKIVSIDSTLLENFRQMQNCFDGDPEALYKIAATANDVWYTDENQEEYVLIKRLAVAVAKRAVALLTDSKQVEQLAATQNLLGLTYVELAEVEDKADNCRAAIEAYQAALKVRTPDRFPTDYAMTQNNLGNAYGTLSEVEDKAANCQKAIEAYQAALEVYTRDRFPVDYATTQNSLGTAHQTLGEVEDKVINCQKAIEAYQAALEVRTRDRFPMDYAKTQSNLGVAYRTLGEVEDKATHCRKAIEAYQTALEVRTRDRFPMQYAATQNNLGNAYITLSEVKDKATNCRKAIEAYQAALEVRTRDRFPMDYAMTQNNLGAAYQTIAEVHDKAANCRKAIEAYGLALEVYTRGRFPMDYAMTQDNLGNALRTLGEVEDKAANCRKAIEAYLAALEIYTRDGFPMDYAMTQDNLGNALRTLGEVEDKAVNCRKAIDAFQAALEVRTRDRFPMQYATTQYNLGIAYGTLSEVEDKASNCRKATEAYDQALEVYQEQGLEQDCQLVERNLALLADVCNDSG